MKRCFVMRRASGKRAPSAWHANPYCGRVPAAQRGTLRGLTFAQVKRRELPPCVLCAGQAALDGFALAPDGALAHGEPVVGVAGVGAG